LSQPCVDFSVGRAHHLSPGSYFMNSTTNISVYVLLWASNLVSELFLRVIDAKTTAAIIEPRIPGIFETELTNPWSTLSSASKEAHEPTDEVEFCHTFKSGVWVDVCCHPVLAIHAEWEFCNYLSGAKPFEGVVIFLAG